MDRLSKTLSTPGVRGPKCLNDGPTRWSKKFSDRFSRFDTIPAVTDTQPRRCSYYAQRRS